VAEIEHPHIVIDCPTASDETKKFDIGVKATGVDSGEQVLTILLLVVEKLTGVSTDGYVRLVDEVRRVAAREQAVSD
jgi:hypothetical protein